jgi:hypothetical protein
MPAARTTRNQPVTERVKDGFGIDTSALKGLSKDLRRLEDYTARNFRRGMREVGEVVAMEARSKAGEVSKKIAGTIKVRAVGATVEVRAGAKDVPEATLLELGNTGSRRSSVAGGGTFKHPVFGTDVWVEQPMHPYLYPSAVAKLAEAEIVLERVVDEALRASGFEGG